MRVEDHVSPRLIYLATQLNNTLPLFKAWGVTVQDKARANARRKGGRRLWKMIASMTRVTKLTPFEAHVECLSYIGAHKEYGGIIRVKEKSALTIPIIKEAQGMRAEEFEIQHGVTLFRPKCSEGDKKNVIGYSDGENFIAVYALCKATRRQKADKWWPDQQWTLDQGIKIAEKLLEKQR